MRKKVCVIYMATNKLNKKRYIGQTVYFNARKAHHLRSALLKRDNTHFHRALLKYGFESFKWEILEVCNNCEELNDREKYYIHVFNSFTHGYNMSLGGMDRSNFSGENHPMFGKHYSIETKRKLREFNLGKKLSEETKIKIGKAVKGRVLSEETKRKLSMAHKGKKMSEEAVIKMRKTKKGTMVGKQNPFYGKKHSKEIQDRITNKISLDWVVEFPDGRKEQIKNLRRFCRNNGLVPQRMCDVAFGNVHSHKGFKCKKLYKEIIIVNNGIS